MMPDLDDAAANLARTTDMTMREAKEHLERLGAQFTQYSNEWMGDTVSEQDPHLFMTRENITKADLGEALREYRNLDTWDSTPWARDEIGVLSTDFINWYRWERL